MPLFDVDVRWATSREDPELGRAREEVVSLLINHGLPQELAQAFADVGLRDVSIGDIKIVPTPFHHVAHNVAPLEITVKKSRGPQDGCGNSSKPFTEFNCEFVKSVVVRVVRLLKGIERLEPKQEITLKAARLDKLEIGFHVGGEVSGVVVLVDSGLIADGWGFCCKFKPTIISFD